MDIMIRLLITTLIVIIGAILGSIVPESLKYIVGYTIGSVVTCLLFFYVFKEDKLMSYYSYHNRLKQLLETENYICVPETGKFACRFIFPRIMKSMPIRDYRVEEYKEYIEKENI